MTDPVTIAREVLGDELAWAALDPGHHPEGQAAVYRLAAAAPTLARTVPRLAALADKLEQLAAWERTPPAGSTTASPYADGLDEAVTYIRIALNGETRA